VRCSIHTARLSSSRNFAAAFRANQLCANRNEHQKAFRVEIRIEGAFNESFEIMATVGEVFLALENRNRSGTALPDSQMNHSLPSVKDSDLSASTEDIPRSHP
jgi:hypothetical protein